MIIYNHAYDIYNCAFRILALLYKSGQSFSIEQIKIFDFIIAFPEMLYIARLPKGIKKGKRVQNNQYISPQNHQKVFYIAENFQIAALNHLAALSIIDKDEYARKTVCLADDMLLPKEVILQINHIGSNSEKAIDICINHLYNIPVNGIDGLKHRTKVMEYRYD